MFNVDFNGLILESTIAEPFSKFFAIFEMAFALFLSVFFRVGFLVRSEVERQLEYVFVLFLRFVEQIFF